MDRSLPQLLVLFIWVVFKKLCKKLLKYFLLFCLLIIRGIAYFISWWTDGNTRQKRQELWERICRAAAWTWAHICKGVRYTWRGIVWTGKETFLGILHLRTTIVRTAHAIHRGYLRFRATDFKAIFKERWAALNKAINDFVEETDPHENNEEEEELLKEYNSRESYIDRLSDKIDKYLS